MLKRIFFISILLLTVTVGFAQPSMTILSGDKRVEAERKFRKGTQKVYDEEYQTRQQRFDELNLMRPDGSFSEIRTALEKRFVKKGEVARIKFVFNSKRVLRIEVEDAERGFTPKDQIKGEYIAVVKPEKTKVIRVNITTRQADGSEGITMPDDKIIVVLDGKEFEKLDAKFKKCEEKKDIDGLSKINVKINDYIREAGIDIKTAKRKTL